MSLPSQAGSLTTMNENCGLRGSHIYCRRSFIFWYTFAASRCASRRYGARDQDQYWIFIEERGRFRRSGPGPGTYGRWGVVVSPAGARTDRRSGGWTRSQFRSTGDSNCAIGRGARPGRYKRVRLCQTTRPNGPASHRSLSPINRTRCDKSFAKLLGVVYVLSILRQND
jgi:hypothetical protein